LGVVSDGFEVIGVLVVDAAQRGVHVGS
jgi:hypothetical protein